MEIETPSDKFKNISYDSSTYNELTDYLAHEIDKRVHHLCLFLGLYKSNKKKAANQLASKLNRTIRYVDTSDLISRMESETTQNMDNLFKNLDDSEEIIYFKNGEKLCGVYTGNSQSRVKYATPEERHFIKKVQTFNGLVILDMDEYTDADKTLRRAAESIVSFTLPDSKLKRFFWHLKNYSFNGNDLKTKRPEAYKQTA